ncbi:hypothetical protein ACFYXD_38090 [Streptomyces platensis]|uniref:hypothetical protein n=1 Tax=Streptomyces platensis TaxID=58346 RepID=UPI0036C5C476
MGFPGRIIRGPMAADVLQRQFTQIYNGLFRDRRLSFKAKGIFGLISTHRDGFGVSEEAIAAFSTDGLSAVRSGLKELIAHDYLKRDRARDDLGRLGESAYYITDMPDGLMIILDPDWDAVEGASEATPQKRRSAPGCENLQLDADTENPRSAPTCDFPGEGNPSQGNRTTKNTNLKKINKKNTNPVRPSVRDASAHERDAKPETDGRTDGVGAIGGQGELQAPAGGSTAVPVTVTPGVELLLAIGNEQPEYLLTGRTLAHQGLAVSGMLLEGWTPQQIRQIITGRPLPDTITTTVGGIVSGRLRAAMAAGIPPAAAAPIPAQPPAPDGTGGGWIAAPVPSAPTAADRTWDAALNSRPPQRECDACGDPAAPGQSMCPECLGWPHCKGDACGRWADPAGSGFCSRCVSECTTDEMADAGQRPDPPF